MPTIRPPSDVLTSFATAVSLRDRQRLLDEQPTLKSPRTVSALCEQAARWSRKDPAQARKAADAALWLSRVINDLPSQGLAHRTLANILASLARTSAALSEYRAALRIFINLDDRLQTALTRSSALTTLTEAEGSEAALDWAAKARHAFQEAGDRLRLARLENNLAVLLYRQEDYAGALAQWRTANATLQDIGETSDQAATLRNLAVCSISLNKPEQARMYYKQARELCVAQGFTFVLHEIDYNIAYLHYLQGDHHRALGLYQAARARSRELGDTYHEALCSLDEAEVYIELNLLEEADTVAQLAATQFREHGRPYETAKALFNLALVTARRGDYRSSLLHLQGASDALRGQGNILWPGQIELLRASVYFDEGRYFEARRSAELARSRFRESKLQLREAQAALLIAKVLLAQGEQAAAEAICRESTDVLRALGEPDSLFQAYFLLGRVLEAQADAHGALEAFSLAEGQLTELRERRSASQLRISVVEQPLDVYAHLVTLLLGEQPEVELTPELFRLVESAKARSFADQMALSRVRLRSSTAMRSQLVDQVSKLRQELSWLYRRLDRSELPDSSSQPSVIESLRNESRAKEAELAERLALLRVRDPHSQSDPERIGVYQIRAVQDLLRENALLEFYIAHDVITALILTPQRQLLLPIAVTSRAHDLQRKLWHYLNHPGDSTSTVSIDRALKRTLGTLYQELLAPLEDLVEDLPLLIVPHGFLFQLPFHAFIRDEQYLFENTPVSYLPSAASIVRLNRSRVSVEECLYFVRPSHTSHSELAPSPPTHQRVLSSLEDIPPASCVHLLADAELRGDNPLFSSIKTGSEERTFLDLHRSEDLGSVLSLQGSGFSPDSPDGDREVAALWNALLATGVRGACVPTNFASTSVQREHASLFYTGFFSGQGALSAHRRAMRALFKRGRSIQELAGFFFVGDPTLAIEDRLAASDHARDAVGPTKPD